MPLCQQCQKEVRVLVGSGVCPRCLAGVALGSNEVEERASHEKEPLLAGRYRLGKKLGEGGFGAVYLAEQRHPLCRQVAVKLLREERVSKEVLARFEAERQALAMMDHPHIATIFDGGEEERRPFFVMEYVDGLPISEFCAKESLSIRARLSLFTQACEAVHYAHQKGVIHRDLKPSNILVARADDETRSATCKVIDFGIAKAMDTSLTDRTYYTQMFQLVGTPAYMSPEQADTTNQSVDTRSDVYSLGAVLYELLSGTPPFRQEEITGAPLDEVLRRLREEQPDKPSTRLLASDDRVKTRSLEQFRGDLDWITMKALEKEPDRRYESAAAFGQDIQRFLNGEAITARPPSKLYQMRMFARRNRGAVIAASLVLLALTGGIIVSAWQASLARAGESKFRELFYVASMNAIQQSWEQHDIGQVKKRLHDTRDYPERGFEWYYWKGKVSLESLRFPDHTAGLVSAAAFPDGKRMVTLSAFEGFVWDLTTRKILYRLDRFDQDLEEESHFVSMTMSPDGRQIITAQHFGQLTFWDAVHGNRTKVLDTGERMLSIDYAPDGKLFAATFGNIVRVRDSASGETVMDLHGHTSLCQAVAYSPNGKLIAAGGYNEYAIVWNAETGQEILRVDPHDENSGIRAMAFTPDGRHVASGSWDTTVSLWSVEAGEIIRIFKGHAAPINTIAFSQEGSRLLTGSNDQLAKLWDLKTGEELLTIKGHRGRINDLLFLNENNVLTASHDTTVALWDTAELMEDETRAVLNKGWVSSVAWGPNGEWFMISDGDRSAIRWDALTGERLQTYRSDGAREQLWACDVSDDGRLLLTGGRAQTIMLWDVESGALLETYESHEDVIQSLAFSPEGKRFVSACEDGTARVWSLGSGQITQFEGHGGRLADACWLPDGNRIVSVGQASLRVWDAETGRETLLINIDRGRINAVAVSPDGRFAVSGGDDMIGHMWDLETGQEILTLQGHTEWIWSIDFSPDGKRIVTAGFDKTVRLWDAKRGEELLALRGHTAQVWAARFSPDGQRILTGGWDKTARVWEGFRHDY